MGSENCNDHGDSLNDECWCDWGWYGDFCSTNGIDIWGASGWFTFRVVFAVFYFIILGISFIKLNLTLGRDKITGLKRFIYRLFRSPKNLSLFFLMLIGLFRGTWLMSDPLRFDENLSRVQERLLYEIVYPLIFGLYASVLLVWGGLYQGMRSAKSDPFRILRKLIMGMMILAFPAALTISTLKGYRVSSTVWGPFGLTLVLSGVFLMLIGFSIFGILLIIYVEKHTVNSEITHLSSNDAESHLEKKNSKSDKEPSKNDKEPLKSDEELSKNLEELLKNDKKPSKSEKKTSYEKKLKSYGKSLKSNGKPLKSDKKFPKTKKSKKISINFVDLRKKLKILNKEEMETKKRKKSKNLWGNFLTVEEESEIQLEIFKFNSESVSPKKKENSDRTMISLITKEDRAVFRTLGLVMAIAILLGLLVLVFFSVLASRMSSATPTQELVILYCVFSTEVFACTLIYVVFTLQIQVKEKSDLRFFTSISLEMNKKLPKIKYPPTFALIGSRLHNFYS